LSTVYIYNIINLIIVKLSVFEISTERKGR